ncbi:MAG: type I restriction endonuclease [Verrucomicrobiota bacterium]
MQELIFMPHAYTEDQLVEQPAIGLFAQLGWTTVPALEETFGATGTLLRETPSDVVLVSRLRGALERLNPVLPPEAITGALDDLTRDRSAMSLEAANREVYLLLKEGIKVSVPDIRSGMPVFTPRRFERHITAGVSEVFERVPGTGSGLYALSARSRGFVSACGNGAPGRT